MNQIMDKKENNDQKKIDWTKASTMATIFGTIVSVIVTVVMNLIIKSNDNTNQLGDKMNAIYETRLLNNNDSKTIVVCLENGVQNIENLEITPTFQNLSEYALKDFSLSFETKCSNIILRPSVFVDTFSYGDTECHYWYKEKVLSSFDETKPPFKSIYLKGTKGRCQITTKASYNGISSAFKFYTDILFFVVPNNNGKSYEDWKNDCKAQFVDAIKDYSHDIYIYYYTRNHQPELLSDIPIESLGQTSVSDKVEIPIQYSNYNGIEFIEPTILKNHYVSQEELNAHHELIGCKIVKTDSTLKYYLTLSPNESDTSVYMMLEGRHKPDSLNHNSTKYEYGLLKIGRETTTEYGILYHGIKAPEIDQVSLYPQCKTEDVIHLKQKNNKYYIVKNKTRYTVVCFIHYSDNSTTQFVLDGGEERTIENIGVYPIEVFNTYRKAIQRDKKSTLRLYFSIPILSTITFFGLLILLVNIGPFLRCFFSKKNQFDIRKALGKTMFSNLYKGYKDCESHKWYYIEIFLLVMSLLSPVCFYLLFKQII